MPLLDVESMKTGIFTQTPKQNWPTGGIFSNPTMVSGGVTGGVNGPTAPMDAGGLISKVSGAVTGAVSGLASSARQALSGLGPGGKAIASMLGGSTPNISFGGGAMGSPANSTTVGITDTDWRIRVSVNPNSGILYRGSSGIMYPLVATDGVIFPYVPTVTIAHLAKYGTQALTHTNYTHYFYESSEIQSITITGDFSVQTQAEGDYFLASLYFFRGATKMFYSAGKYQGSPPPIVYLDGYGTHYLPHVPCVITNFSHTMPNDVDYIEVNGPNRVPVLSTFTLTFQPVYSRAAVRSFDFDQFASGALLDKGFI